ncbi:hypothetical protein [Paraglaciecola sp. 25GB23A]|uniref:hypothetical protein n=1 Tax=Paraglaciecola sp. 25GB23A TaxID=3156068 RepID=UPI0032AF95D7
MKEYFKNNWVLLVFCILLPFGSFLNGDASLQKFVIVSIACLVLFPVTHYMFIVKFKVDKQGPIPWYGSPILWMAIPVLGVIFYIFM